MTQPRQRALDLPHRPALGSQDFLVAPGNAEAMAWLDRWPDWPGHALALYGPAGCGKSHLAQVFAARTGAPILSAAALGPGDPAELVGESPALVVEDGEGLRDSEALFHVLNGMRHLGRSILLTGRLPPARWNVGLADLASRLASLTAVEIRRPDDELMSALLVKLFADRQLKLPAEALPFLMSRMERSFGAVRDLVAQTDRMSLETGRAVTLPLLREALRAIEEEDASGTEKP